jgi:hypothetical protein
MATTFVLETGHTVTRQMERDAVDWFREQLLTAAAWPA